MKVNKIIPESEAFPGLGNALRLASAFSFERVIERFVKEKNVSRHQVTAYAEELKIFLSMCATNKTGTPLGMAGPVDDLWHTFLLFTREYQEFCNAVAGSFIHHEPNDAASIEDQTYAHFLREYRSQLGIAPDADVWPKAAATGGQGSGGVHTGTPIAIEAEGVAATCGQGPGGACTGTPIAIEAERVAATCRQGPGGACTGSKAAAAVS